MHNFACPEKWDTQTLQRFWQTDYLISDRGQNLIIINNKKKRERDYKIEDFAVTADHGIKLKESEKKNM